MVAMNNLDMFAPDQVRRTEDESQLERPLGRRRLERHAEITCDARELAPVWPCEADGLAHLAQTGGQLDALVIRATAGEQ
jgi:hypothetical protein